MAKSLEGKVAIVTGSGQGIGKGIAIYLAREGAKVITNNRKPGGVAASKYTKDEMPEEDWNELCRLKGDAQTTADIINAEGGEAIPFFGDVSKWDVAESMVKLAIDTWGRIDILVNNAAGLGKGSILTLTEEDWDYMTISRSKAAFNLMHFAVPHMIEQGSGRIINVSSDAWVGLADNDAYSCSTAGIVGLTWASSKELFRHGITVNAFCPQGASPGHAVEYKKMVRNVEAITGQAPDPKVLAMVEADHADPVGLGPITAFMTSDDAGYISGNVFAVTASGKVSIYANPVVTKQIYNDGKMWTVEELKDAVKKDLLGEDYVSPAASTGWGH